MMATELAYPHIVEPPNDSARLEKHPRTRVSIIVNNYQGRGWSAEEIVRQYLYLSLSEVDSASAYYHDAREETDSEIADETAEYERLRLPAPIAPCTTRLQRLMAQRRN